MGRRPDADVHSYWDARADGSQQDGLGSYLREVVRS